MSERHELDEREELMAYWQQGAADAADPTQVVRQLAGQIRRFDRSIFWRNAREYAAGAVLIVWSSYDISRGDMRGLAVMAGVLFVTGFIWWKHRSLRPLDPSADAQSYRRALLERFNDQIRLARRIRYWYLLPLYPPVVWTAVETWPRAPWAAGLGLLGMTAIYVAVGWLNERYGVRKLREARARVEATAGEAES